MMRAKQSGFSLIEVSIASLVFAIGLIGLAALQRLNIHETNKSIWLSTAFQLAQNYAESAKSNQEAANTAGYVMSGIHDSNLGYNCENTVFDVTFLAYCLATEMARADISFFSRQVQARLPNGKAEAVVDANNVYQITISWVDPAGGENFQYQMQFMP